MMIKNPHLGEEYFVSSFISGLKDEIKTMIRILSPATLSEAFEIATLQEDALKLQVRNWKTVPENRFGISRSSSQQQIHSCHYKVPSTSTFRNTLFKGKPISTADAEPKRLSAQELQYRRSNGLFQMWRKIWTGSVVQVRSLESSDL